MSITEYLGTLPNRVLIMVGLVLLGLVCRRLPDAHKLCAGILSFLFGPHIVLQLVHRKICRSCNHGGQPCHCLFHKAQSDSTHKRILEFIDFVCPVSQFNAHD